MKLSAPIYRLKREAKLLSRNSNLPLHAALDQIALQEGFRSWSLLAAAHADQSPAARLYPLLSAGELLLIAARPGQGKTLFALELLAEALRHGHAGVVFSLEYTATDCMRRLAELGVDASELDDRYRFEGSDRICAELIADQLVAAPASTFIVVDYLQLLDQRREHPPVAEQVKHLRALADARRLTIALLSQVDRNFETSAKSIPSPEDLRLPNPVDLNMFDRMVFLHDGVVEWTTNEVSGRPPR